jgi:hypothetical protein
VSLVGYCAKELTLKVTPHQVRFLQSVTDSGVQFTAQHWALGDFILRPSHIEAFTEDADQYVADQMGVRKDLLQDWGLFIKDFRCIGETKAGERCKASAPFGFRVKAPGELRPDNPNCFCSTHTPVPHSQQG